jgi:hypothetical protein
MSLLREIHGATCFYLYLQQKFLMALAVSAKDYSNRGKLMGSGASISALIKLPAGI